jgi:mono/diheme cytochrome c family protein
LKSGGMIYIDTRDTKAVSLNKPITVFIPTRYIDSSMSLFKGEVMKDSTINWVPSDTLQPTFSAESIKAGKLLYVSNCASCHAIKKDIVGPALAQLELRGSWKNHKEVMKWINNPPAYMANDKSGYTKSLKNKYAVMMVAFPQLKQKDIDNLLAFIRNEEKEQVTDTFALPTQKPCNGLDTIYFNEKDTVRVPDEEVQPFIDTTSYPDTLVNGGGLRNGFTDVQNINGAYRFEIKTLGWYNVDAFFEPQPNTVLCDLQVVLTGGPDQDPPLAVYAFFPANKNLSVGIYHDRNNFHFEKVKDKIPLYLGEKGIIVAFGNVRDQFFFGSKMFTVQKNQTIQVTVSTTTHEQFLKLIKQEQLERIDFDVLKQQMRVVPCDGNRGTDSTATK